MYKFAISLLTVALFILTASCSVQRETIHSFQSKSNQCIQPKRNDEPHISVNKEWVNNNLLITITEYQVCGFDIKKPLFKLRNDELNISYEFHQKNYLLKCFCNYESTMIINGLPVQDYKINFTSSIH